MSWAMDRLGRSLADLIDTLRTLESANVDLFLHHQAIDTTTPAGRMFFHVMGAFADDAVSAIMRSRGARTQSYLGSLGCGATHNPGAPAL
jgi:DNA invertase Pin-like site-specific DNA recombinase